MEIVIGILVIATAVGLLLTLVSLPLGMLGADTAAEVTGGIGVVILSVLIVVLLFAAVAAGIEIIVTA